VKVQSKRDDGYCRKVILKNTGKDKIIDWKLSFVLNKDFSSFWSANYKKTNSGYEITPKSWNKEIKPSEEVTFGFCVKNATDTNWEIIDVQTQQDNSSENT
jgi:cellulase/cellobiase CelA1